ncbi:hypothetical protein ACFSL4_14725 [Streptomyces caeni]|uniref:Uncharacterized protein n=1 Tax=Streptomyces caeni TaxID=2307231 RepID=A0ABW4IRP8_9ACTN
MFPCIDREAHAVRHARLSVRRRLSVGASTRAPNAPVGRRPLQDDLRVGIRSVVYERTLAQATRRIETTIRNADLGLLIAGYLAVDHALVTSGSWCLAVNTFHAKSDDISAAADPSSQPALTTAGSGNAVG